MTNHQKKAVEALESYRMGKKLLAHHQWEEAKVMMLRGVK